MKNVSCQTAISTICFMLAATSCSRGIRTIETSESSEQKVIAADEAGIQTELRSDHWPNSDSLTDSRDGEVYAIVRIGAQTWMAENLRFEAKGSLVNPNFPSADYGRLYSGVAAQTACPEGWHLPSDSEWNELELSLGMSPSEVDEVGWRGDHGTKLKSSHGWKDDGNGTNSSGFNALPAGYNFDGDVDGGLGRSVGFWGAAKEERAWIRFVGGPRAGVNRMESDLTGGLACRCLKDESPGAYIFRPNNAPSP